MGDQWAVRQPHPALRQLITRYIGYRRQDVTERVHRGLPSRHVTVIISLEQPVRMLPPAESSQAESRYQALVGGMHLAPVLIAPDRSQAGLHLELNPLGIRALLGVPAAQLSGQVVDLAEFGSRGLATLPERLACAADWESRFAILDHVFCARLGRATDPAEAARSPQIDLAWRRLIAARGGLRVAALAGEVGWSRRHLADRFRREVGLTPKQAARVLRFERAADLLRRHDAVDLADVAIACGYYDQAHLSNEWRALSGCPPGTWIAEELPILRDSAMPAVAAE